MIISVVFVIVPVHIDMFRHKDHGTWYKHSSALNMKSEAYSHHLFSSLLKRKCIIHVFDLYVMINLNENQSDQLFLVITMLNL